MYDNGENLKVMLISYNSNSETYSKTPCEVRENSVPPILPLAYIHLPHKTSQPSIDDEMMASIC